MLSPYNWLAGLIALVTGTAGASQIAVADIAQGFSPADLESDPSISKVVVKRYSGSGDGSWKLAAHRSHSSHSSHRSHSSHQSHYSGTGGGSYTPPSAAAPPTQSPPPAPKVESSTRAPLLAPPPSASGKSEAVKLAMKIQLALNSKGYCSCAIDGVYGGATEKALRSFQKDNGLKVTGLPNVETLERLGISF